MKTLASIVDAVRPGLS